MRIHYDVALIRVHNFTFPDESILEPCPYYFEDTCMVLATCGMGKIVPRHRGPEYFHNYSENLREIFLRERPATCLNPCPNDVICTKPFYGHTNDNIFHGDSGGPLYIIGDFPDPEPICVYGVTSYIGKFSLPYFGTQILDYFTGGSFFSSVPFFYEWIVDGIASYYVERGLPQPGND
ncbi:uncharacterized protein LOC142349683 isoform X1 [Convolutriloba macropyga]|uniref:uncharacterized protein LOC142349683 isoform X1 n=1 Tax=Convolutriloba macropyga TaxID=536237 RepID=UPI003F52739D